MRALPHSTRQIINEEAKILYGLIHARYILSTTGQFKMAAKFKKRQFGCCNRTFCKKQPYLPVGLSVHRNVDSVKLFCPKCEQIYEPLDKRYKSIDGAYFGTAFPHLFFFVFPEYAPAKSNEKYKKQLYGYNINEDWKDQCMEVSKEFTQDIQFCDSITIYIAMNTIRKRYNLVG